MENIIINNISSLKIRRRMTSKVATPHLLQGSLVMRQVRRRKN
ncbi:MAG: hypothetical protein QNK27_12270 [Desulfuromusa sp.]|nr:hypothetical protein [Desulfuromusa sp.]